MPLAIASVPSTDWHAAYLDYLGRTGRGNAAYWRAARSFFGRWPDPQLWAAEPLAFRLSADLAEFSTACRDRQQRTGKDHHHYLAAVSNTQRVLFHLGVVDSCPARVARSPSPNGWPRCGRRSGRP